MGSHSDTTGNHDQSSGNAHGFPFMKNFTGFLNQGSGANGQSADEHGGAMNFTDFFKQASTENSNGDSQSEGPGGIQQFMNFGKYMQSNNRKNDAASSAGAQTGFQQYFNSSYL